MKEKDRIEKRSRQHVIDSRLRPALEAASSQRRITCTAAFALSAKLNLSPVHIGRATDFMGLKLCECQLGLFGYKPEKSIVPTLSSVPSDLEKAISKQLCSNCLPCQSAWQIADERGIEKVEVSAACNALKIKIKPCQLGAF